MESEEESQRPLVTADEVLRLPEDNSLIFVAGQRPILGLKARYFEDPTLAARSEMPPPRERHSIPHRWDDWRGGGGEGAPEPTDPDLPDRDVAAELEGSLGVGSLDSVLEELPGDEDLRAIG